jgi:glutathione S-transferase
VLPAIAFFSSLPQDDAAEGPMPQPEYELFYWPSIPGRGEFVRLPLEDAGVPYVDVARRPDSEGGGARAILKLLADEASHPVPLAVPVLRSGSTLIAHTALILDWLAPRIGLAPADEAGRLAAHQLQLTIGDFLIEAHDVHHPLGVSLYYEDQKPESLRRAQVFHQERLPKFLRHFERVLDDNGGQGAGREVSYVDLSLFQVMAGLEYAFPNAMAQQRPNIPRLLDLVTRVAVRPRLAAYLASPRRLPFNEHGIFRHYPELDL